MVLLPVYILAGGKSSRFGSDKARALLEGEALIARLAHQIAPIAAGVTVIADAPDRYADLGLRTIADRRPGLGPLAGLEAALLDLIDLPAPRRKGYEGPSPEGPFSWLAMLTCDMTAASPEWIGQLHEAATGGAKVICFCDSAGRRHPFPGLYHIDLLAQVQQRLDESALAVQVFIDGVDHVAIPAPADWPNVAQVNTPEDLRRAEQGLS